MEGKDKMNLREKIEAVIDEAMANGALISADTQDSNRQNWFKAKELFRNKILSAIKESLPEEKDHGAWKKTNDDFIALQSHYFCGFNSCLSEIKAILKEKAC